MVRPRPRRWWEWTIRSRMVVIIVPLAALALIIANVAAVLVWRSSLVGRIDAQLAGQRYRPFPPFAQCAGPGIGPDSRVLVYNGSTGAPVVAPTVDNCE